MLYNLVRERIMLNKIVNLLIQFISFTRRHIKIMNMTLKNAYKKNNSLLAINLINYPLANKVA